MSKESHIMSCLLPSIKTHQLMNGKPSSSQPFLKDTTLDSAGENTSIYG